MKKILSFIILVSSSIICMAQQGIGTPFNFCSLNGVQYNPGWHPQESNPHDSNMWVVTREDEDLSECERLYYEISFRDGYPGHTILGPATVSYNCHGYSHSICQGGDTCNVTWCQELCTGNFVLVQTPQKEDIAVIRTYIGNNEFAPTDFFRIFAA